MYTTLHYDYIREPPKCFGKCLGSEINPDNKYHHLRYSKSPKKMKRGRPGHGIEELFLKSSDSEGDEGLLWEY